MATAPAVVKAINIRTMTKEDATFKVSGRTLLQRLTWSVVHVRAVLIWVLLSNFVADLTLRLYPG